MRIIVATHNEGKLKEIRRILAEDLGETAQQVELVSAGSTESARPGGGRRDLPGERVAQGA